MLEVIALQANQDFQGPFAEGRGSVADGEVSVLLVDVELSELRGPGDLLHAGDLGVIVAGEHPDRSDERRQRRCDRGPASDRRVERG